MKSATPGSRALIPGDLADVFELQRQNRKKGADKGVISFFC